MSTKRKIAYFSRHFFNVNGYGSVSIQQLANAQNMSRGNFTYHFKEKEDLLIYLTNEMWEKMEMERRKARQFPSFENLHNEMHLYYKFQKQYSFIFLDSNVLRHPHVNEQFKQLAESTIKDNDAAIAFAISLGNMRPEPINGVYHNISITIWLITFYWLSQQVIRGKREIEEGEKMSWSLLIPHFTDKGIKSFKDFFGKEFYENLGTPFNHKVDSYISF